MIDADKVGVKLTTIAQLSEDLSAELFEDSPETAKKFGKIAIYCRRIASCVRLYGQIPIEKPRNPVFKVIQSVDRIAQTVKTVVDRLPTEETRNDLER